MYIKKDVVETVDNPAVEISLEEAREKLPHAQLGDVVRIEVKTKNFGRIDVYKRQPAHRPVCRALSGVPGLRPSGGILPPDRGHPGPGESGGGLPDVYKRQGPP